MTPYLDTASPLTRRPARRFAIAAALLGLSLSFLPTGQAWSQSAAEIAAMDAATDALQRGMDGDKAAIDAAADQFARLLAAKPGDPLVMVYAGSSTALRADTTLLPWKKMRFAEDGLAQIDKSLLLLTPADEKPGPDGTPKALETRFVAASTYLGMPGFFNRRTRGEKMLQEVLDSTHFAGLPMSLKGAIWLRAGLQAIDDGRKSDARRWMQMVVDGKAPQAPTAKLRLKDLGT